MDSATEMRLKMSCFLLAAGGMLYALALLSDSSWAYLGRILGFMLLAVGAVVFLSVLLLHGNFVLLKALFRNTEPEWAGEFVHDIGSGLKVRYKFDDYGSPWFVASDVCIAIGAKPPREGELKCGAVPLLMHDGFISFSETNVQTYLASLAMKNHTASLLLVNIRNNVLRKLERQRDDTKRYG
jgi:hypothetical protein